MPNMARTKSASRGAPRNVPAIALDLLNLQYAKEQGDETNAEIQRQKLDAKIAGMQSSMWEKNYNTAQAERAKAWEQLRDVTLKLDAMKQDKSLEVEDRKQQGETKRLGMSLDDAEEARTDKEWEIARNYTNLLNVGMTETQAYEIASAIGGVKQEHEKVLILRELQAAYKRGDMTDEQFMAAWQYANGVQTARGTAGTRQSGTSGAGKSGLTVGEKETGVNYVLNVLTSESPVETTEPKWWLIPDSTQGNTASTELMYDFAYDMADAAGDSGLTPDELLRGVLAEIEKAEVSLRETGGHEGEPASPGGVTIQGGGDKDADKFAANEDLKDAQKIVNFFHSTAGRDYLSWVRQSQAQGKFIIPRWQVPSQTQGSTAPASTTMPSDTTKPDMPESGQTTLEGGDTRPGEGGRWRMTHPDTPARKEMSAQDMTALIDGQGGVMTAKKQADMAKKKTDAINRIQRAGTRYGLVPRRTVVYSPKGVSANPQLRKGDRFVVLEYVLKGQEGATANGVEIKRDMQTYNTDAMFDANRNRFPQETFIIPVTQFQNFREIRS